MLGETRSYAALARSKTDVQRAASILESLRHKPLDRVRAAYQAVKEQT
jgi:hypothetical protein